MLEIKEQKNKLQKINILIESKEFLADFETPVSVFYKLCKDKPYSFLLESVENSEKIGRYSIIGTEPILIFNNKNNKTTLEFAEKNLNLELEENPFLAFKNLIKNIIFEKSDISGFLGFYGYFGYENIRWIEPKLNLKSYSKTPDSILVFPGELVIFDHIQRKINLISIIASQDKATEIKKTEAKNKLKKLFDSLNKTIPISPIPLNESNDELAKFESNYSKNEYLDMVNNAKKYIHKGDIFQIVPSQKLRVNGSFDGFTLYRVLRSINPSPYLFYMNLKDFELAGSSPEVFVKCEEINSKRIASVRPIAGTYPRGKNEEEDKANILGLSNDPKEKAEHLMLVDLARNDLGRVCETGSINVPELMVIEKYSHVFHMVSLVQGILKTEKTSIDLLCACFPHGTLSGAPKIRAMEIINQLEKNQRGPYGGCMGFYGLNDTINTCMTIRTFVIFKDHLEIQAGGGIVADSDPENEYKETLRKGAALLKAISLINS